MNNDSEKSVAIPTDAELAQSLEGNFRSDFVTVDGVRLHYVANGSGTPLILMPGWLQNWWAFRKVMPALAAAGRRVIAVDIPGMGASDKPETGYDKKTMAETMLGFIHALGYEQADIAGHDIGSQVGFSLAVNHPEAVRKVALLDILHPDPSLFEIPMLPVPGMPIHLWWFALNQVVGLPEELLAGRMQHLTDWVFDHFLVDKSAMSPLDRAVFARAYDTPDAIRGCNAWFQTWIQDIEDLGDYGKVTVPMLGVVSGLGDGLFADQMQATLPKQGVDVKVSVLPGAGHYFVDEAPQAVIDQLDEFFD